MLPRTVEGERLVPRIVHFAGWAINVGRTKSAIGAPAGLRPPYNATTLHSVARGINDASTSFLTPCFTLPAISAFSDCAQKKLAQP